MLECEQWMSMVPLGRRKWMKIVPLGLWKRGFGWPLLSVEEARERLIFLERSLGDLSME